MSKIEQAVEIVKNGVEQRFSSKTIRYELAVQLNITNANAFVYFTKACQRLGIRITNGEGRARGPKRVAAPIPVPTIPRGFAALLMQK